MTVISKSDEQKADERYVARQFGVDSNHANSDQREAVEIIARRSQEAYNLASKERKYY